MSLPDALNARGLRADLPAADHGHPRRDPAVALALDGCEAQIDDGLASIEAALRRIRDEKLYRAAGYRKFSAYLRGRWATSRQRLLKIAEVEAALPTTAVLPAAKPIGTVSLDELLDSPLPREGA